MEPRLARPGVRLSDSPRRSPLVAQSIHSPTTSVAGTVIPGATMAESLHDQPDPGLRTTDFFDDADSDDGDVHLTNDQIPTSLDEAAINPIPLTGIEQLDSFSDPRFDFITSPTLEALYGNDNDTEQLSPTRSVPVRPNRASKISSSFNGSVKEILPPNEQDGHIRFQDSPLQPPPKAHISQPVTAEPSAELSQPTDRHSNIEQIIGAHVIAHGITLQALMRREDSLQSYAMAPLSDVTRISELPAPLRTHDPRSPQEADTPATASTKKAQKKPSPIETSTSHRISDAIVRTPYPLPPKSLKYPKLDTANPSHIHAVKWRHPGQIQSPGGWQYGVLTVSVRSNHHSNKDREPRLEELHIPDPTGTTEGIYNPTTGQTEGELEFRDPHYTDELLFKDIHEVYTRIVGRYHRFAARKVLDVKIVGRDHLDSMQETMIHHGPIEYFRNPALGKEHNGLVEQMLYLAEHAHIYEEDRRRALRLPVNNPNAPFTVPKDGFEIIVGWAVKRILIVLSVVVACSVVASVLWISLGSNSVPGHTGGIAHDAADRVASGIAIGICALLLGLTGMAGWMGISWNSMR